MFRRDFLKTTLGLLAGALGFAGAKAVIKKIPEKTIIHRVCGYYFPPMFYPTGRRVLNVKGEYLYRGDPHAAMDMVKHEIMAGGLLDGMLLTELQFGMQESRRRIVCSARYEELPAKA